MTYRELITEADRQLDHNKITLGEYEEMTKPLDREIEERKVGKWKRKLIDSGYNSVWLCSECKEMIHLEFHDFKFCPYCGADMRGAEND